MEQQELARAIKGLAGFKANFTRGVNRLARILPLAEAGPTHAICGKVQEDLEKLEVAFERLEARCTDLALHDDDEARCNGYVQTMNTAEPEFSKWRASALGVLAAREISTGAAAGGAAAVPEAAEAGGRPRPVESLRPERLSRDHTLADLRAWERQFRDFFEVSRLAAAPRRQQQAHFRACLDANLQSRVNESIGEESTIDQCIAALREDFYDLYPVFSRRLDFFKATQKAGERFSDTAVRLQQLADVADLDRLNAEELMMFRYVGATRDERLREKLLRLEKPTLKDMKSTIRAHEAAESTCDAIEQSRPDKSASASAAAAKTQQPQQESPWQKLKKKLRGKCLCCANDLEKGKEREHKAVCPARECICKNCGKKGTTHECAWASPTRTASRRRSRSKRTQPAPQATKRRRTAP